MIGIDVICVTSGIFMIAPGGTLLYSRQEMSAQILLPRERVFSTLALYSSLSRTLFFSFMSEKGLRYIYAKQSAF